MRVPPGASGMPPYRFQPGPRRDVLVLCDHASNAIPPEFAGLGLDRDAQRSHVAWDPGAAEVAARLATRLGCPAFFGGVSRLVADLNRAPDSPEAMLATSEDTAVPGNRGIGEFERQRRIVRWHQPYHHAIARHLTLQLRAGIRPALLSVHSFTPVYHGHARPWPIGLLWKTRERWLDALFAWLRAQGWDVGDNQPYDATVLQGYSLAEHGEARGLRHLLVELRNDGIATADAQQAWADRLHDGLEACGFLAPR